jgi:long-subunit fatty acid transport protein
VVTFASAVIPIKNKFTLGAYYHQPLRNEGAGLVAPQQDDITGQVTPLPNFFLPVENGNAFGNPISEAQCESLRASTNNPFACLEFRLDPFASALDVRLRSFGLAGAWQIHPKFSIGATVRHQRFSERAATVRFTQGFQTNSIAIQATAKEKNGDIELEEETDTTFAAGFKWSPTDKISVGGVYKKGPKFVAPFFFAGQQTNFEFIKAADTTFHIPDIAGLGVSVRPMPALTVNVDAVRVKYSNLVDDFVATVADVRNVEAPFGADDVVELHAGAEYFFSTKIPIALRGGYWRDPAHNVEWRGPLNDPNFIAESVLYPKGESQNHFSIGAGMAWTHFQIDAAYDTSDQYKVGSISMVTRF